MAAALFAVPALYGQSFSQIGANASLMSDIDEFCSELKLNINAEKRATTVAAVDELEKKLASSDFMFDTYFQTHLNEISANEAAMAKVVAYKADRETLTKALAERRVIAQANDDFIAAENFITPLDTTYKRLYKSARKYSATSQTAKLLEKVKAKEALLGAKVQEHYGKAAAAVEAVPGLASRMEVLEEEYADVMSYSVKIQEAEYKPLVDRVKDYLMSFAAVAIMLMFINMIQSKISAAKQVKENMKKIEEALKKDDEIPEI